MAVDTADPRINIRLSTLVSMLKDNIVKDNAVKDSDKKSVKKNRLSMRLKQDSNDHGLLYS